MTNTSKRRPRGSVQLRKEKRAAGEFWGYDVWIRQEDGTRKRYREFTFATKAEASTALAALNHCVQTSADLKGYRVPRSPLTKKCEDERDRVLSDEEISKISTALCSRPDWADVLFFFRLGLITGARMAEVRRMRWDESSERFGTVKLYSSKTKKWRTLRAPSAASLIAERKVANHQDAILLLLCSDHRIRKILKKVSESVDIRYGQNVLDGWCPHDLRHTCLTNLAVAGVPLNGIKEYAGHASIVETQRYLKFMPESIELAARQSTRLAQLTGVRFDSQVRTRKQSK